VKFSNPRLNQMTLNIQWELKPAITVTPFEVVFQDQAAKELRQKLSLKQVDGRPFRITSNRCSLAGVRVEGLNQKAATQDITVILPATLKAGRYSETLALSTDDPDQPELTIRVTALLK